MKLRFHATGLRPFGRKRRATQGFTTNRRGRLGVVSPVACMGLRRVPEILFDAWSDRNHS